MLFLNLHHHNQVNLLFSFTHRHTHSHKLLSPSPRDILLYSLFVPLRCPPSILFLSCLLEKGKNRRRWWGLFGGVRKEESFTHSPIQRRTHLRKSYWKISILIMYTSVFRWVFFLFFFLLLTHNHGIDGENVIQNLSWVESESWVESREKSKNCVNSSERNLCETKEGINEMGRRKHLHGRNYEISFRLINVSSNSRLTWKFTWLEKCLKTWKLTYVFTLLGITFMYSSLHFLMKLINKN